jgi:hypothetical protein
VQSFAEILADELARLDPCAEIPPAAAFELPKPSFELGLMSALSEAFFLTVAPAVVPPPPPVVAAPVDRLLRGFCAQHVEPTIVALKLDLFEG